MVLLYGVSLRIVVLCYQKEENCFRNVKKTDHLILILEKGDSGGFVNLLFPLTIELYSLMLNNRIISSECPYYPGTRVNATLIVYGILTICF